MDELSAAIAALIYKHLCDDITADEQVELQQWVAKSPANEILFNQIQDGDKLKTEVHSVFLFNQEEAWVKLLRKMPEKQADAPRIRSIAWLKLAGAAAIVTALSFSIYWFVIQKSKVDKPAVAKQNTPNQMNKAPGQNGAILVLDNGNQLLLDSAGNGTLTVQGNVDLVKKDGQLIYDAGSGAAKALVYNTMITPKGRQYNLTLSDGTKVWLNSASSMRFPVVFNADERKVEITGEAYFEVSHVNLRDGKRRKPFIVHINKAGLDKGMDVEVLGTHFNVNAYDDEESVKTTLLLGKVSVKQNDNRIELEPGQQATYTANLHNGLKVNKDVDLEKVVAWKNGRFEFDDTELPVIMRQISRWYDIDIVYEQSPSAEKFGGAISKSVPLFDVVKMLEVNGIKFRLDGTKLYVKP